MTEITEDGFLDGRVRLRQFSRGFRSGLDAMMLAASVPAGERETVLELGSGAGAASLCVATRVPDCMITGVDIHRELVALANENACANGMGSRARFVQADVLNLPTKLRTPFDHVLCNPPFHDSLGETSPDEARAQALQDFGDLPGWLETGVKRTASGGTLTVILRADRLTEALDGLPNHGVSVFPLWPKRDVPAKRVLIQLRRGKRAPLALLSGLVLHENDGRYTPEADAILRSGAPLPFGTP
ncbi:MAG: methyltransferase [Alphaproteobacteria bacterium]|nr:methyltransferase [Alphaproteobacteria bacterium]